ncbi:hypothetical protein BG015_009976 [Linnemannia schmuckeri]|uniref:Homeobox domain-containing protein n=1 Tax=Linnemannia schmuckeri TaxID=64567 RepID=A0A9P5V9E6_9FUNG|nr:hypothetical protein BG015_009976 [Linnemannia schmuckeri]
MSRTSTAVSTPTTEPTPLMAIPVMQKVVDTFDWKTANNVQEGTDDRTPPVPSTSPVLEPPSDYSPSLKLAEEINQINQINQIRQMKEGTISPSSLPTAASSGLSATSISVGISTLLAQTAASASQATTATATASTVTQNVPTTALRKTTFLPVSAPVPETLACPVPPISLPSPPPTNQEPVFSSIHNNPCPTSTTPLFRFKSTSFQQHEEETIVKIELTDLPMTPPSSQEFQEHDDPLESSFEIDSTLESNEHHNSSTSSQRQPHRAHHQQHHHQQTFHPFDRAASSAPRKTLNWVNAVPSHFSTSPNGQPRKRRRRTNREELEILEDAFAKNLLPDAATRQELGERLGMSVRAVQIWFQNRRQTLRKKSISGSGIGGVHPGGSEDDLFRSDGERINYGGGGESHRRSSGDSNMSASPVLLPTRGRGHVSRLGSRSCSDLMSSSPPTGSLMRSPSLARADTCSALPASLSPLTLPLSSPPLRPAAQFKSPPPQAHHESTKDPVTESERLVTVKAEETEPLHKGLTVTRSTQELADVKTADRHLNMLLQEAKRRSGQCNNPVMATWSEKSSKPVLNSSSSLSGTPSSDTTFFPASKSATIPTYRSLSTPTIPSSSSGTDTTRQPLSIPSQSHSRSAAPKSARKHRSMPEPLLTSTTNRYGPPYPRTMSLMEQVLNRQKQQHQPHSYHHHHRPAPSNFKQSTLSKTGKHTIDSVANRASKSFLASVLPSTKTSTPSSTGISTVELARRLQLVMGNGFKRIQSQSKLGNPMSPAAATPTPVPHTPVTPTDTLTQPTTGQPAMRARRLSIGQNLFDSDTEDEMRSRTSTPSWKHVQQQQQQQPDLRSFPPRKALTHQAQKRTARTQMTPTNGDETDEEDFQEQAKKRASMAKTFGKSLDLGMEQKPYQQHHQRQRQHSQDSWSGVHKMPRKVLRTSMSLITSSPTREYGVELEHASRRSPGSFPILERNHSWGGVLPADKSSSPLSGTATAAVESDDMNMDEIECANVLAGLGWGR